MNFLKTLAVNSDTGKYYKGFLQFEDYPFLSNYGLARGVFFLTACKQVLPTTEIYPEFYTICYQGCPDGALAYAYPPFGHCLYNPPVRIKRRTFEYAFATCWHNDDGFHYWSDNGFQAYNFDTERYETLIKSWAFVRKHTPAKPLKGTAFISNSECCRKSKPIAGPLDMGEIPNVANAYKTSEECIAFAYETARQAGLQAGFQSTLESLDKLSANELDLLVLPPLAGATDNYLQTIRRLHSEGVNLLGFEDVTGLEDLFGVAEVQSVRVHNLRAIEENQRFCDRLDSLTEYTDHFACKGKYVTTTATILINAELPVLVTQQTATGKTAFFNIPPTVVRRDQLHQRAGYGRESISQLINSATAAILEDLSDANAKTTAGELIAFETTDDQTVIIVENISTDKTITPKLKMRKQNTNEQIQSCNVPYKVLQETDSEIILTLKLEAEHTATLVIT